MWDDEKRANCINPGTSAFESFVWLEVPKPKVAVFDLIQFHEVLFPRLYTFLSRLHSLFYFFVGFAFFLSRNKKELFLLSARRICLAKVFRFFSYLCLGGFHRAHREVWRALSLFLQFSWTTFIIQQYWSFSVLILRCFGNGEIRSYQPELLGYWARLGTGEVAMVRIKGANNSTFWYFTASYIYIFLYSFSTCTGGLLCISIAFLVPYDFAFICTLVFTSVLMP